MKRARHIHNQSAAEEEGIDISVLHMEVDRDLDLTSDEIKALAALVLGDDMIMAQQPVGGLFTCWYALEAFVLNAPDQGIMLQIASNTADFLFDVLTDEQADAKTALEKMRAWMRKPAPDEESDDAETT